MRVFLFRVKLGADATSILRKNITRKMMQFSLINYSGLPNRRGGGDLINGWQWDFREKPQKRAKSGPKSANGSPILFGSLE